VIGKRPKRNPPAIRLNRPVGKRVEITQPKIIHHKIIEPKKPKEIIKEIPIEKIKLSPQQIKENCLKTLQQLYDERHGECDKGAKHSYISLYEKILEPFRNIPVTFVELGIFSGWSLDLWSRYFIDENTKIIGVDISPSIDNKTISDIRQQIIIGNCTDPSTFESIDKIDIVIDDASHTLKDQTESFNLLFPLLNIGGIYCIEDIQNESNKNELLLLFPFEVHAFNKCSDDTILIARKT